MNIQKRMDKAHTARKLTRVVIMALGVVDMPFRLIALPHTLFCKAICRIGDKYKRLAFGEQGMCGGCSRFGTNKCKKHVKNPYAQLFKDCYEA